MKSGCDSDAKAPSSRWLSKTTATACAPARRGRATTGWRISAAGSKASGGDSFSRARKGKGRGCGWNCRWSPEADRVIGTMSIRVAIVEDDEQVRENLATLIRETKGFECVGTFGSGELLLASMPRRSPDVVLMDVNLPGMSGVECVRLLKARLPDLLVVILTVYDDSDRIFQALQMGASGYLLKRSTTDEILRAIEEVHRGGAPMSSHIARKVVQSFQRLGPSEHLSENLSRRESDVLGYVARGYTNKEIAEALGLSAETVRGYLKTIYSKLQVRSRTAAAMKFFK